jgi:hypothetical protein
MKARKRSEQEHLAITLPTRSVRVTRGRLTHWIEMGSRRASVMPLVLPDFDEIERIMREIPDKRKAVET